MRLLREPGEIDRTLLGTIARMRHERRMENIRELDIDAWVQEQLTMTDNHEAKPRWTDHPDAYPDLDHCPSCGAKVHKLNPDPRCHECDRDLRLPRYAVKDQLCLVCKVPEGDAADEVTYLRIDTGERACSNCLADLRAFKFELEQLTLLAEWVSDQHREDIHRALAEVADAHDKNYRFNVDANAEYGRMEPVPEEERTITLQQLADGDVTEEELRGLEEDESDGG